METVKAGGYVSKVHFNDGTYVDIQQNDIIIFVGPNNAGKSQSLKDIYTLASEKQQTTVVTDITIKKSSTNIKDLLDSIAPKEFQEIALEILTSASIDVIIYKRLYI